MFFFCLFFQVGERSFPLEAVKRLKELMDLDDYTNPYLDETRVAAACANPLLPQVFQSVCQAKGTDLIFSRLGKKEPRGNKIHYMNSVSGVYFM